jgi:hypothetical protein
MTGVAFASAAALASGGAVGGLAFGLVYFAALRRTVDLFGAGRRLAPAALTLGRLAGAISFFGLVARLGALPLLSAFVGFLLARTFALRAVRSTA